MRKWKKAGNRIRDQIFRENNQVGSDELVDAAISFDSTWAKRGFTSIGVVFAISIDTGEGLNYHVLSKERRQCTQKKSSCKNDEEFEEWQMEHLVSGEYDINFTGSSPAMEAEAAKILEQISWETQHPLQVDGKWQRQQSFQYYWNHLW